MKGLEEERGRGERDGCPQNVKILWLVLDKDLVRSFDVCGAHSHEDVRTIFYFEYLWPAPAGAQQFHHQAGLPDVHNQRDSTKFSTPFLPILSLSLCPILIIRWISGKIRMIFITVDTQIPRIGEDTMGEEISLFLFLSLDNSFVARDCCTGLVHISQSETRVGWVGRCLTTSLKEASSSVRR